MKAALGKRLPRRLTTALGVLAALAAFAGAARLPIKTYTIADGLAMDQVNAIRMDSRGFLWFATSEGLSWFDGYRFTTYGVNDGIPSRHVNDVLETRSGEVWVIAGQNLCRFRPDPATRQGPRFEAIPAVDGDGKPLGLVRVVEAADGSFWCGTSRGLFRYDRNAARPAFQAVEIGLRRDAYHYAFIRDLLFDPLGNLWIASGSGLIRRGPDGRAVFLGPFQGEEKRVPVALERSPSGELWVATESGLFVLDCSQGAAPRSIKQYTRLDGLPSNRVSCLLQASSGRLWVGTFLGLACLTPQGPGKPPEILAYTAAHGLADPEIVALAEDREHNVWAGTDHGGALKIGRLGFELFDETDGLEGRRIMALVNDQAGKLNLQVGVENKFFAVFDGRRFYPVDIPGVDGFGWVGPQAFLQDRTGGWWMATGTCGVWHYPPSASFAALSGRKPTRTYTTRNGLPSNFVYAVFEDSRGDIWLSTYHEPTRLVCLHPSDGRVTSYDFKAMATAWAQDRAGDVWAGLNSGEFVRFHDGKPTILKNLIGNRADFILEIYRDSRDRFWVSTTRAGVVLIADPTAPHPTGRAYTTRDGLSSDHARFVVEAPGEVFYVGTTRGVDRLDLGARTVKHFSTQDGLAGNLQNVGRRDSQGNLWFGALLGLSRLVPETTRVPQPPDVRIRGLRLGGIPWPVNELGQTAVLGVEVPLERNRVFLEFSGVSNSAWETLEYRYKLDGVDAQWRNLGNQRTLELPDVRPGDYRFLVQAINADGLVSPQPAVVAFRILTPLWRRWWFIALGCLLAGGFAFALIRMRVRRRLEMERIRTRIATDLHDDIGSSLSQIAILSEVAVRRLPTEPEAAVESLEQVSGTSRTLVDAMSDIVWAINPARDHFSDLVHRMRRFANDLFTEDGVEHHFNAQETVGDLPLGADVRRQVFLVFKECLNNIVKHAEARQVKVDIQVRHGWLELEIKDDGKGFDPEEAEENHGHGLRNLRRRAETIGGKMIIASRPGAGTTVQFGVPATHRGSQPKIKRRERR